MKSVQNPFFWPKHKRDLFKWRGVTPKTNVGRSLVKPRGEMFAALYLFSYNKFNRSIAELSSCYYIKLKLKHVVEL